MKNILKLAFVVVVLFGTFSCSKSDKDGVRTENARLVGTWKWVKTENVENGKRSNPREVKDDGCTKYVFTDKTLTNFYPDEENKNNCVHHVKTYRIENDRIYYGYYEESKYEELDYGFKFVDDDTFEEFENTSNNTSGQIITYKRVK